MRPDELRRYADMMMKGCIALRRGDTVIVRAALPHRELAVALTEAAYRGGADVVEVEYDDPQVTAARIVYGSRGALAARAPWRLAEARALGEESVALVQIRGAFESEATANLPAARVAEATRLYQADTILTRIRREGRLRGTICTWPTNEWAAQVYPELDGERAKRRLAQDILSFCRLGPGDPPGHKGWTDHLATLRRRAARLTKLDLKELHVVDDGTDLRLRIAPHSLWRGGGELDHWGRRIAMNVPTEECFISPDAAATEGTFRFSRPRSLGGRMLEGFSGEFRGGRLVRLTAKRRNDRDWFAGYLDSAPGGDRLGEIALVDASSRIGQTGRIYYDGLLDENAAAHMAFGSGFAKTRTVPIGRARHGVNRSRIHVDVMIGTDALNAYGITQTGKRVALVRDGAWEF
jgi:aminopeptidase